MTGRPTDATRLSDILRSIERLEEVLQLGFDSYAGSWINQSATVRELEIIGEAAGYVSSSLRAKHPEIRWAQMRGFSSFARHEYWRLDPKLVWKAVVEMPALKEKLARVIPSHI
jgi:uncharacterized protein with HEPN domain